ncbi:hypothetical protein HJFPF1_03707 [Paramyrothecium foliicola]|nr:hypothetical protein HJFPF1_03707 [Paramyrothecium foliicola]
MGGFARYRTLPISLLALISVATADQEAPRAVKKLTPDLGEKLLAKDLAFSLPYISPYDALLFQLSRPEDDPPSASPHLLRRAFAQHYDDTSENVLRRAAEALAMLERRAACPSGMNSCADIGSPNKCCQQGTYCTSVQDSTVGGVACCPQGSSCGGNVGNCPSDAGAGCVLSVSASSSRTTATETEVATTTEDAPPDTITTTRTTVIEGEPSTVVVTLTVTTGASAEPTTRTSTEVVTVSESESISGSATGNAPWRPTSGPDTTSAPEPTQTGCPTGFYGCLATHGGGCCRTDRNCETASCPPQDSTTIVSDGATVVVAATDVPPEATSTCADGWFMCGAEAGPVAGCCPSGFQCGTASCFSVQASQTAQVQKEFPDTGASQALRAPFFAALWVGVVSCMSLIMI